MGNQDLVTPSAAAAEALEWPEQEPSEFLSFQRSLWELASAIAAEHALSLPLDQQSERTGPSLPAHEPEWLVEEDSAAAVPLRNHAAPRPRYRVSARKESTS
jgi:hypothetical protein